MREVEDGRAVSVVVPLTENGRTYTQFGGEIVVRRAGILQLGLLTIAFDDPGQQPWAEAIWESFHPPAEQAD